MHLNKLLNLYILYTIKYGERTRKFEVKMANCQVKQSPLVAHYDIFFITWDLRRR